jgi:hypothetical protein
VRAEDVSVAGSALLALRDRLPALLLAAQHAWHVAALNGSTGAALVESAMSSALAPAPSTSSASAEPFQAQGARLCTQPIMACMTWRCSCAPLAFHNTRFTKVQGVLCA